VGGRKFGVKRSKLFPLKQDNSSGLFGRKNWKYESGSLDFFQISKRTSLPDKSIPGNSLAENLILRG